MSSPTRRSLVSFRKPPEVDGKRRSASLKVASRYGMLDSAWKLITGPYSATTWWGGDRQERYSGVTAMFKMGRHGVVLYDHGHRGEREVVSWGADTFFCSSKILSCTSGSCASSAHVLKREKRVVSAAAMTLCSTDMAVSRSVS